VDFALPYRAACAYRRLGNDRRNGKNSLSSHAGQNTIALHLQNHIVYSKIRQVKQNMAKVFKLIGADFFK
jgi:hypothetical protein